MKPYRRRLSREDVETATILITKERQRSFPPPMRAFAVEARGQRFATRIVAEDCTCAPPPHQHYRLQAGHFRHLLASAPGRVVEIGEGGLYRVRNGRDA